MATTSKNEPDSTIINNVAVGLYYYYVPKNGATEATYLGFVNTIESVTYNPFIDEADISDVRKAIFDTGRYGSPDGQIPYVKRICSFDKINYQLGDTQKIYPKKSDYSYDFEPRVLCYPFRYFLITDYSSNPMLIKPERIEDNNTNNFKVKVKTTAISSESKYNIYVENYKYDDDGNLEGMCNSTALMLPVTSSAYSQFLATSASSFNQSVTNALLENDLTLKHNTQSNNLNFAQNTFGSALNIAGSLLSGNVGGILGGANNLAFGFLQNDLANRQANENSQLNEHNIISMKNAKVNDMLTTPNSIKTAGNDTLFNLINSNQRVDLLEYRCNVQQMSKAQEYFKRYGYKVNSYDYINLTCRKHYNYVKTNVCNIVGARIPHEYLDEIKAIFNNGITVWHMDNEGTTMFEYDNNVEVYN